MEATAKPRLGRGLNSLLGDLGNSSPVENVPITRLPIEKIQHNPYQPRKQFDEDESKSLAASVRTHGILQPLVVRQVGDGFQLIAGERRLRAARDAGLPEVPVHLVAFDDQQVFEAALVENIQRSDLNAIEKAQGFKDYLDKFGLTNEQLGAKLSMDRTTISNLLGLLNLPQEVQDAVRTGQITLGHAKILKGIAEPDRQIALCREIIAKSYSVHALDQIVKLSKVEAAGGAKQATEAPVYEKTAHVKGLEDDLRQRLATRIEIKLKAKDKGQIVIGFESNDDFERIIEALKR